MRGFFAFVASALALSSVVSAQKRITVKISSGATQDLCIGAASYYPGANLVARPCADGATTFFLYDSYDSMKLLETAEPAVNLFVTASDLESEGLPLVLERDEVSDGVNQLWTIANAGGNQSQVQIEGDGKTQCFTLSDIDRVVFLSICNGDSNQSWKIINLQN